MPDNLGYTPGSGATVATDEIGGLHFQRVKPTHGVDGVAVDVSATNPLPVRDETSGNLLSRLLSLLAAPLGYDKSLQRYRQTAIIESGTVTTVSTVTTVTAVSSLTNLAGIGGYNASMQVFDQNRVAWAQCVRARIT